MRYILIILAISSGLVSSTNAGTVCPNPVFTMNTNSDVRLMHQIFDYGPASKRWFTEVHYIVPKDPHLTVGMGHWIDGKLVGLFQRLKNDNDIWNLLTSEWANSLNQDQWDDFASDTEVNDTDAAAISQGLTKLFCIDSSSRKCNKLDIWSDMVGARFNSNSHWFHVGWNAVSILPPIAQEQVQHWTDSIVKKGQLAAKNRQLHTFGGVATAISAVSSSLKATLFPAGATLASVDKYDFEQSLIVVPTSARPNTEFVNEEALLNDWKSLVAWQYYSLRKKRVRSRMREIWRVFYEPTWGPVPKTLAEVKKIPKHSGCYMANGTFDTSAVISPQPFETNCKQKVLRPKPLSCSTQ